MAKKPRATLFLEALCEVLADIGTPSATSELTPFRGSLEKEISRGSFFASRGVREPTDTRVGSGATRPCNTSGGLISSLAGRGNQIRNSDEVPGTPRGNLRSKIQPRSLQCGLISQNMWVSSYSRWGHGNVGDVGVVTNFRYWQRMWTFYWNQTFRPPQVQL